MSEATNSGPACPACRVIDLADGVADGNLFPVLAARVGHERRILEAVRKAEDKAADRVTRFAGSLPFVYLHSAWFAAWIFLNAGLLGAGLVFDGFPFGLLTLIVSLEAIFLSTFVMISQNREAARADIRSQLDFETNLRSEIWSVHIGHALGIDANHVEQVVRQAIEGAHAQLAGASTATPTSSLDHRGRRLTQSLIRVIDEARFRQVLGHFATGVTVVTGAGSHTDGSPVGLSVNSFTSVSIDPPLVAFCVGRKSTTWPLIRATGRFTVNILSADQEGVSRRFASTAAGSNRFEGIGWHPSPAGSPVMEGALAWIDATIEIEHEAGDHVLVIGRVTELEVAREGAPLVFYRGGYGRFEL
jgi:flavin reductase (DIM6/NTAB) family NADH-FMN oxidoreductase RutF/uncharacterized membrane protein